MTYSLRGNVLRLCSFTGCCWISSLVVGRDGDWIVSTTIDLNVRRDTGKINSSPISATSPIIRLKQHCSYSLPIHTDDPDGDKVRCRWAVRTDSMNECGGVCNSLSGAILDEVKTTVSALKCLLKDFLGSLCHSL